MFLLIDKILAIVKDFQVKFFLANGIFALQITRKNIPKITFIMLSANKKVF